MTLSDQFKRADIYYHLEKIRKRREQIVDLHRLNKKDLAKIKELKREVEE